MFCLSAGFKNNKKALAGLVKRLCGRDYFERLRPCFHCWSKYISPLELAQLEVDLIREHLPAAGLAGLGMLHLDAVHDAFHLTKI